VGCSGWNYADWRGVLYPPGCPQRRWLARYAEVFDTVEINTTFYRLPSADVIVLGRVLHNWDLETKRCCSKRPIRPFQSVGR